MVSLKAVSPRTIRKRILKVYINYCILKEDKSFTPHDP